MDPTTLEFIGNGIKNLIQERDILVSAIDLLSNLKEESIQLASQKDFTAIAKETLETSNVTSEEALNYFKDGIYRNTGVRITALDGENLAYTDKLSSF